MGKKTLYILLLLGRLISVNLLLSVLNIYTENCTSLSIYWKKSLFSMQTLKAIKTLFKHLKDISPPVLQRELCVYFFSFFKCLWVNWEICGCSKCLSTTNSSTSSLVINDFFTITVLLLLIIPQLDFHSHYTHRCSRPLQCLGCELTFSKY